MRNELAFFGALLLGSAAALGASIPTARGDTTAGRGTIGVSEIHEGMKGYGLTVFHGTEPERFDVEVIGVLHNFRPSQDLIVIRTPNNARLEIAKGVHGMSGSPIYLDGRLAGAASPRASGIDAPSPSASPASAATGASDGTASPSKARLGLHLGFFCTVAIIRGSGGSRSIQVPLTGIVRPRLCHLGLGREKPTL